MSPTSTETLTSLEVAARFTQQTTLASWVVVRRQPGVVRQAHAMANQLGLELARVEIDAGSIALRFTPPRGPSTERRMASPTAARAGSTFWAGLGRRALAARAWRRLKLRRPKPQPRSDR